MKNTKNKNSKKSLKGFNRSVVELHKGEKERNSPSVQLNKGAVELNKRLVQLNKSAVELNKASVQHNNGSVELNKGEKTIFLPIVLLKLVLDYIPRSDGDFDEWQKNYVRHLGVPWPPPDGTPLPPSAAVPVPIPLFAYLGIPLERFSELLQMQQLWNTDFARGGQKTDRRSSEAKAKQKTRRDYVALIRSISQEYILHNRKSTDEIKRALKLTVPDTEPTPVHGTDAPVAALKNAGGSVIDFHCKRNEDQTRPSVIRGYIIEMRYFIGPPSPTDPDMSGVKTEISAKAHFKFTAGMTNLGKTFYCYLRWRSKTDSKFNSPWTNLLQIVIA